MADLQNSNLEEQLNVICSILSPEDRTPTINTLLKIVQNALDNPGVEQYRQIRTANKVFSQRVWRHLPAQEFLTSIGWVLVDDMLVLPSDDLLQEAHIELIKAKSILDQVESPPVPNQPTGSTSVGEGVVNTRDKEYQERMKKLTEAQRKVKEEKKKIADQIMSDRRETGQREAKSSQGRQLKFGANLNRFEDIGVDLNAGGG